MRHFLFKCIRHNDSNLTPGWLAETGYYLDFAGSGVVHLLGASCSLIGCWFMGARLERFDSDGKVRKHLTTNPSTSRHV